MQSSTSSSGPLEGTGSIFLVLSGMGGRYGGLNDANNASSTAAASPPPPSPQPPQFPAMGRSIILRLPSSASLASEPSSSQHSASEVTHPNAPDMRTRLGQTRASGTRASCLIWRFESSFEAG